MNKKLFTQIRNEWRSNLWLALELLLVSVVMWYIIDLLYCRMATYLEPRGLRHGALLPDQYGRAHRQESRLYTL